MNWWGKLIGTGVGLLGGQLVHWLVQQSVIYMQKPIPLDEQSQHFVLCLFSCAKIAKADGVISAYEIEAIESIMERRLNEKIVYSKMFFEKQKQ